MPSALNGKGTTAKAREGQLCRLGLCLCEGEASVVVSDPEVQVGAWTVGGNNVDEAQGNC